MASTFIQTLRASFKSKDTEENIDVYFTRPIGLVITLICKALHIHPNAITIVSIFLGVGAGWMFHYADLYHNLWGIALLMAANFCDSADGQLARLTGQKTLIGRMLDGLSGDLWFFAIYVAICFRLYHETIPGLDIEWGLWIWALAAVAGFLCHSPQSSLADYYRQIHLFLLKGATGSELDSYESQREVYKQKRAEKRWLDMAFFYNYANYCKSQERRTPAFQLLKKVTKQKCGSLGALPEPLRQQMIEGSRPLMKYTNILTFNVRAICIYITCLADIPWLYLLVEITVLNMLYAFMHNRHEQLCRTITAALLEEKKA